MTSCLQVGITLTAAQCVIFAELYWNPGPLIQVSKPSHRPIIFLTQRQPLHALLCPCSDFAPAHPCRLLHYCFCCSRYVTAMCGYNRLSPAFRQHCQVTVQCLCHCPTLCGLLVSDHLSNFRESWVGCNFA